MRYHNITKCDLQNGEGIRVVLWVSHCEHMCKNCHNPQTWSEDSGVVFDSDSKEELFVELDKDYTAGITLSGGDPLSTMNRKDILILIKEIKFKYPNKDIWCYTGYTFEEIKDIPHMKYIDVLVDGKFIEEQSKPSPKWCGSSNQKIIDVKETLKQNKIILHNM